MQSSKVSSEPTDDLKRGPPYVQYKTRRIYELWFKLQVVRETMAPGASVSIVARRHNINTNVVFAWRRQYHEGVLKPLASAARDGFVPVGVIGEQGEVLPPASAVQQRPVGEAIPVRKTPVKTIAPPLPAPAPAPLLPARPPEPVTAPAGSIELQLAGTIKVRVEGHVDARMLRNVLSAAREFT